jgi:hypothetical protein
MLFRELHRPREYDHYKSIHVDDGVTVTSLSASIQYKKIAVRDHVCHIALNRTLSR